MKRNVIKFVAVVCLSGGCINSADETGSPGGATSETTAAAQTSGSAESSGADASEGGDESGAPSPEGQGAADTPIGRRIRRMTADQYMRSLEVVTGQTWGGYEEFAAAMGQPDYVELVDDDRTLSVTFQKFAFDAASATCRAAVDHDVADGTSIILRHATVEDEAPELVRANLRHLMLRFLAVDVDPEDPSLDPWAELLLAPHKTEVSTSEVRMERWTAVCVGLATHPDFITY